MNTDASPISFSESKPFDLAQHLFDTAVAMNRTQRDLLLATTNTRDEFAEIPAPRERQLVVRDDHVQELLAGITDLILARRRAGLPVGLAAEEMQTVLTWMLRS